MELNDPTATINALLCACDCYYSDVLSSWRLQTSTVDISLSVAAYGHL